CARRVLPLRNQDREATMSMCRLPSRVFGDRPRSPPIARVGFHQRPLESRPRAAPVSKSATMSTRWEVRFDQCPLRSRFPSPPITESTIGGNRVMASPAPNIASQVTPLARPVNWVPCLAVVLGKHRSDHGNLASGAPEGWRWAVSTRSDGACQRC
ncbi:hypothetical protein, partial [Candidatus Oscillochloris fontis]|uniref:hypothetical protein n=1 Tax=Candidatus Oscillochloris fontis TaxID=2496868 RepID=UPI001EE98637